MKRHTKYSLAVLIGLIWGCGGKEPDVAYPDYLNLPGSLVGYKGSGLIDINGGLSIRVTGVEKLDNSTNTYSGVLGSADAQGALALFTAGQPLPYDQSSTVPVEYQSNGELRIMNTNAVGTYPMGIDSQPTPTGAITDLTLNLPGPQLYFTRSGTLTIDESTIVKSEAGVNLYRLRGTFQATMNASGVGTTPRKPIDVTGSFDVLLSNR